MNLKIKNRESFRPFAPSILEEDVFDQFAIKVKSPYMLFVAPVKKELCKKISFEEENLFGVEKLKIVRSSIPAVTHVDYSARVQTVGKKDNLRFYKLIKSFKKLTDCPSVINTSFNVRGEPIICTPTDAFKCFMGTDLDILVIGNFILRKEDQTEKKELYLGKFEAD